MITPSFLEDHISQTPALQLLVKLTSLLSRLRHQEVIENRGTRSQPRWALRSSFSEEPKAGK